MSERKRNDVHILEAPENSYFRNYVSLFNYMHRHTMPPALCGGFNLVLAYVGRAQDSHCDILIGTGIFSKKIGWLKCAFHGVSLVLKYFYLVD